jgi:hypothetical protein
MSFLEIFTIAASSATIFGLIMAAVSVYNGRATQRLIRETRDLIAREEEATPRLIQENQPARQRILQGIVEILGRIDARVR